MRIKGWFCVGWKIQKLCVEKGIFISIYLPAEQEMGLSLYILAQTNN